MRKFVVFLNVFSFIYCANAGFGGPFIFWGHKKLDGFKLPALGSINENDLASLYQEAKSVVLFIRNNSQTLDEENFPSFKKLLTETTWTYLPQHNLPSEPLDYNSNLEVITLVGAPSQQDVELSALFKDAVTIYGKGEVLGILANSEDENHFIYKREAKEKEAENEAGKTSTMSPIDEPTDHDFIYRAEGKAILYTTSAPILNLNISGQIETFELTEHDREITFDDRTEWSRLNIGFKVNNSRLRLRFNFTLSYGYWQITAVNVEYKDVDTSFAITRRMIPIAPVGFSYRCGSTGMLFNGTEGNLTINDFQVEPWLRGSNRFSDAYDCVGFITAPIWSGIFVSSLLIGILFVGIIALMEIKTPTRFESTRSNQLTFTIQE